MNSEYDSHGLNLAPNNYDFAFEDFANEPFDDACGIDLENVPNEEPGLSTNDTACRYCRQDNPECLAQCKVCEHWFCNGSGDPSAGSHLVKHLVRSKHKEVALHPLSSLEGIPLECYHCSNKNVFLLGFVPAKNESMVLLLCRSPCAYQHTSRELGSDFSEWEPIISDKRFISWLIKIPTGSDLDKIKHVTASEIAKIDDYLRTISINNNFSPQTRNRNPNYNKDILNDVPINKTKMKYISAIDYKEIFCPLVQLEADYDKLMKEALVQKNIVLRCEMSLGNKRNIYFTLPQTDSEMRLMQGDEVGLVLESDKKKILRGNVVKVPNNYGEEIGVELKHGYNIPDIKCGWSVEFVWKPITFDRFSAPGLPELNHSQVYAIKMALQRPFSLIQVYY